MTDGRTDKQTDRHRATAYNAGGNGTLLSVQDNIVPSEIHAAIFFLDPAPIALQFEAILIGLSHEILLLRL